MPHLPPNRDVMLRTIAELAAAQSEAARERCEGLGNGNEVLPAMLRKAGWVPRNVARLAGRILTAGDRKRHQQALRDMEAAGLVDLCTVWVRLTDKGRAYVAALEGGKVDG